MSFGGTNHHAFRDTARSGINYVQRSFANCFGGVLNKKKVKLNVRSGTRDIRKAPFDMIGKKDFGYGVTSYFSEMQFFFIFRQCG